MNNKIGWILLAVVTMAWVAGARQPAEQGPVVIDLDAPGDALVISLRGKAVGGLRVDEQGRLGIFGPNETSIAVTIDERDRVQIGPAPAGPLLPRLSVADDVWATGVLRVGRPDAFGDAPLDPNGAIQLGRNLPQAQPMALARFFTQGRETFRLGATAEGYGYWSDGAHDAPLVTFQPSGGREQSGKVFLYNSELPAGR